MDAQPKSTPTQATAVWLQVEAIVRRFEDAWQQGNRPRVDEYLIGAGAERRALLVELVQADLELRLRNGEPAKPEDYLARYPELADDAAVVARLEATVRRLTQKSRGAPNAPMHPGGGKPSTRQADLEKGVELGDFRIEERLGSGGMGIVYRARQISLNRPVALKILGDALSGSAAIPRFRREAQAAAQLHHPGIAQIYFVGQTKQVCYMAMELIDGTALQTVIGRLAQTTDPASSLDKMVSLPPAPEDAEEVTRFDVPDEVATSPMDTPPAGDGGDSQLSRAAQQLIASPAHIRRCCEVVRDAALILDYAHKKGVIHRDIKPGNLMLDREGHVHVIDFGIARFFEDATLTQTGQLVGTPAYMSPEQITGRYEPDPRTDIYALRLVLYELLTLRPPLQAPSREELLRRIVAKPLLPVSRVNGAVPKPLEAVTHKGTAKDRDERYANAAEFAADINRFLDNEVVLAPPYRYAADRGEIAASRPGFVLWLSATFLMLALIAGLWALLWFSSILTDNYWKPFRLWAGGVCVSVSGAFVLVAHGIMWGRIWARRTGMVAVGLLWLTSLYMVYAAMALPKGMQFSGPYYSLLVVSFVMGLIGLLLWRGLTGRNVRDWFAFAGRVRAEESRSPRGAQKPSSN